MFLNCTLKYNMFFLFTDCIKMLCSFMEKPNKWHWIKIILWISILKFKKNNPYTSVVSTFTWTMIYSFLYTLMKKNHLPDDVCIRDIYLCYQHVFTSKFFCLISFFNSYIFCEFWWTKYVLPLLVTYTSVIINTLFLQ